MNANPRPNWIEICNKMPMLLQVFVPFEYLASWFFFVFKASAFFRLSLEVAAAGAILAGLWGLYLDLERRDVDRGVRVATLFAQIAQVHALPRGEGLRALKPSVEALAREKVHMPGLDLSFASLNGANLRGALLTSCDFSDAVLQLADLRDAKLYGSRFFDANMTFARLDRVNAQGTGFHGANLGGASFQGAVLGGAELRTRSDRFSTSTLKPEASIFDKADLRGTNFRGAFVLNTRFNGANITNTDWEGAKGLKQAQLDQACAHPESPPRNLPPGLVWRGPKCKSTK